MLIIIHEKGESRNIYSNRNAQLQVQCNEQANEIKRDATYIHTQLKCDAAKNGGEFLQ